MMKALITRLEEAKADRPHGRGPMSEYDWKAVAHELGWTLVTKPTGKGPVGVRVGKDVFELGDNGGEINMVRVTREPIGKSVPFWSSAHPGGSVGPKTLAYRLAKAFAGASIDYDKDLDPAPKPSAAQLKRAAKDQADSDEADAAGRADPASW